MERRRVTGSEVVNNPDQHREILGGRPAHSMLPLTCPRLRVGSYSQERTATGQGSLGPTVGPARQNPHSMSTAPRRAIGHRPAAVAKIGGPDCGVIKAARIR